MRALLIVAAALLGLMPLRAADDAMRATIRSVIERQMDAFNHDDAAAAYALAAPAIRQLFADETVFLAMVRGRYKPVYRAKDVLFGELKDSEPGATQMVRLSDEDGELWLAIYTLEKQADGAWLISGCVLLRQNAQRA